MNAITGGRITENRRRTITTRFPRALITDEPDLKGTPLALACASMDGAGTKGNTFFSTSPFGVLSLSTRAYKRGQE